MTCIAWDGAILAADKLSCDQWVRRTTTKIRRSRDHLVGCSGDSDYAREALAWFDAGADPAAFPAAMRDAERLVTMMAITPDKRVLVYQRSPHPIEFEGPHHAIGSGADAALAAMYLGCTAVRAIEVAAHVCRGVGAGVDVLWWGAM